MINLYLDDLRDIPPNFECARTYEAAVEYLKTNKVGILSLDHDLGAFEDGRLRKSGYDLVKWICENYVDLTLEINAIYLHTDNSVGRENMYETLKGAQRRGFIPKSVKIYYYPYTKNTYSDLED